MPAPNAFYAQSGGVTAVINATACGVIETARLHKDKIANVYAGRNGIIGALTEDMIDTNKESAAAIKALMHTPGGAFGSARYKLKGIEENRAEYERLIEVFKAHDIGYFFYNGGNDSMDTAHKVSQISKAMGFPVTCLGVPKTVDNDLPVTDNCPGFGSVAKYVAVSTQEAALDVASMATTSTKVFILEVEGLLRRPRESVQDKSFLRVAPADALADDAENDLVGNKAAGLHDRLGLEPETRAFGYSIAQHVAR